MILFAVDAGGLTAVEATTEPSLPVAVPKPGAACQKICLVYGLLMDVVHAKHQDGEETVAVWALFFALH